MSDHNTQLDRVLDCFVLSGSVKINALADFYALDLGEKGVDTLADLMARKLSRPLAGERIRLGPVELHILDADAGSVKTVGLRFRPQTTAKTAVKSTSPRSRRRRKAEASHSPVPHSLAYWNWPSARPQNRPAPLLHG